MTLVVQTIFAFNYYYFLLIFYTCMKRIKHCHVCFNQAISNPQNTSWTHKIRVYQIPTTVLWVICSFVHVKVSCQTVLLFFFVKQLHTSRSLSHTALSQSVWYFKLNEHFSLKYHYPNCLIFLFVHKRAAQDSVTHTRFSLLESGIILFFLSVTTRALLVH